MKPILMLTGAAIAALSLNASPAAAQGQITGITTLDDRLDDITREAQIDIARAEDRYRFGGPDQRQGLSGSVALTYSGRTGNTETQDFTLAGRLNHTQGVFSQTVGVALEFSESNDQKETEEVFAIYDANYYLNDSFYVFGVGRLQVDSLAEGTAFDRDGFIGFGPGYRVVNTPDTAWRLQGGPGVSYTRTALGDSETELGWILSSRLYHRLTDTMFLTNDTDLLESDAALRITNDLGVNFTITEAFSTRVSYLTDYNDSRPTRTDNKLGVSLIYGF